MGRLVIRRAVLPELRKFLEDYPEPEEGGERRALSAHFEKLEERPEGRSELSALVAEIENGGGRARVGFRTVIYPKDDNPYFGLVYAHPAYRRRNLSKVLNAAALRDAFDNKGANYVVGSFAADDRQTLESAKRAYEELGFKVSIRDRLFSMDRRQYDRSREKHARLLDGVKLEI
ncbi:GNAT family N-acetyltransferase [Candidatus Micrarchaeota archaeon]|nr:GNAT family N-acetyltransferase [Candidatus Micrarchaeota archaeon]MBI5177245.1 GNAT family N-acetyltransferase [Candidatus Micrarchaeota archaeon]